MHMFTDHTLAVRVRLAGSLARAPQAHSAQVLTTQWAMWSHRSCPHNAIRSTFRPAVSVKKHPCTEQFSIGATEMNGPICEGHLMDSERSHARCPSTSRWQSRSRTARTPCTGMCSLCGQICTGPEQMIQRIFDHTFRMLFDYTIRAMFDHTI